MKIKTAYEAAVAAFPGRNARAALAQFMRRYSKNVPATHYRCVGDESDVVSAFLSGLGFEKDSDFSVVASEFDPDTRQIRWSKDVSKVDAMSADLKRAAGTDVLFYDRLYVASSSGSAAGMLSDHEDAVDKRKKSKASFSVQDATDRVYRIVKSLDPKKLDVHWMGVKGVAESNAFKYSSETRTYTDKLSETRPVLADLAVLELCALTGKIPLPDGTDAPAKPIFGCHEYTYARHVRADEPVVPYPGVMWAPAGASMEAEYDSDGEEDPGNNPLNRYLYRSAIDAEGREAGSSGLFAVGYAYLRYRDADALAFASDPKRLWRYVAALYEAAYGKHCRVLERSRLAYGNFGKFATGSENGLDEWYYRYADADDGEYDCAAALFAVMLSDRRMPEPDSLSAAVPPVVVTTEPEPKEVDETPFGDRYLTKDDLPGEWYMMMHLAGYATGSTSPTDRDAGLIASGTTVRNLRRAVGARMDSAEEVVSDCDMMTNVPSRDSATTVRAFISGLTGILRKTWIETSSSGIDVPSREWGGPSASCHNPELMVTGLYTGIWTDNSPTVDEFLSGDGLMPFPKLPELASPSAEVDVAKFTKLVDALAEGSSAQLRMAPRTEGGNRYHVVIAETNADWDAIGARGLDGVRDLRSRLANLFAQTVVFRSTSATAAFDPSERVRGYRFHQRMVAEVEGKGLKWGMMFRKDGNYTTPSQEPSGPSWEPMSVRLVRDSYGRTYVVYTVWDGLAYYARCAYRYDVGLPVESAHFIARCGSPEGSVVVRVSEERRKDAADGGFREYEKILSRLVRAPLTKHDGVFDDMRPFQCAPMILPCYANSVSGNEYFCREWYEDRTDNTSVDSLVG